MMNDEWSRVLKEKASEYDQAPRPELWSKLEGRLESRKTRVFSLRNFSIAASVALLIGVGGVYVFQQGYQKGQSEAVFSVVMDLEDLKAKASQVRFYEEVSSSHRFDIDSKSIIEGSNQLRLKVRMKTADDSRSNLQNAGASHVDLSGNYEELFDLKDGDSKISSTNSPLAN